MSKLGGFPTSRFAKYYAVFVGLIDAIPTGFCGAHPRLIEVTAARTSSSAGNPPGLLSAEALPRWLPISYPYDLLLRRSAQYDPLEISSQAACDFGRGHLVIALR